MNRVIGEQAVVLQVRPYRETSAIVSLFTVSHGRVSAVARGARGRRKGLVLQPLNSVTVSWTGGGGLATLTAFESLTQPWLRGNDLAAALYALELVTRLTGERDSLPRLYAGLVWLIESLQAHRPSIDVVLRSFEKLMLEELGYGYDFSRDAASGDAIRDRGAYRLELDYGFVMAEPESDAEAFPGRVLLDIGAGNFDSIDARRAAKRIFRRALAAHLGPRPLVSRRLIMRGNR